MADQVAPAAAHGEFAPEVGTALLHPGATGSWKQAQFGEAKCAADARENQRPDVNGIDCVVAERDIDYYKDLPAHAISEVVSNGCMYRADRGRHGCMADLDPGYILKRNIFATDILQQNIPQ
jgi:hypothetical protein